MLKSLLNKWLNRTLPSSSLSKAQVPKAFTQKKSSIFMNRYAGLIYFLISWHCFGYIVMKLAKAKAEEEGFFLTNKIFS